MTITDFLLARIAEDHADAMTGWRWKSLPAGEYERLQARVLVDCAAKRRIVELHKSCPVLATSPPKFEQVGDDLNSVTMRASQQLEWLTEQEYRTKFGAEPPTAPMLRLLALPYADHPDYREKWRP